MFKSIFLSVFCLFIAQVSFGQDCETRAANKPSELVRFPDSFSNTVSSQKPATWNITKMKPNQAIAESWIKNILTGFTGAKLAYSNEYSLDPLDFTNLPEEAMSTSYTNQFYQATGIKGYYGCKMRFYAYYCYDNSDNVITEDESGSFVHVNFNNVFASDLCQDVGVHTINGKPAFKIFEKDHSEGRIDFYQQRAIINGDETYASRQDFIFIRNSDKPVFIRINRKEYLEQMLKDVEAYRTKRKAEISEIYTMQVKQFEEEMRAYKSDRLYTPEKEAKRRKWFAEDNNPEKVEKDINTIDNEANGARELILQHQGKPQDWLSRGFSTFYPFDTYSVAGLNQYFDKLDAGTESGDDESKTEIVSLNPDYFNNKLSVDVPQLISVRLANGNYPHMLKVAKLIKKPGALAPLEAILNPRGTTPPPVVESEITSTYTLKYLPKLTELTPLIVPADMPPSAMTAIPDYSSNSPAAIFDFEMPAHSPKLNQLPPSLTPESYSTYVQQLNTSIANALKPDVKKKADDYVKTKNLTQSKDISNAAFATWLQNAPTASLYLYSKALVANPSDVQAANNFSAFLIMGGLPEKSIPMLEYWNKQKPGEATLLSNLGNAYYQLGDMDKAMSFLQECVQSDTLNPTANKILCMMYMKKGDTKKAEEHATKSLTTSYDEQVVAILRQLNKKAKPGEIMSRLPVKEFPMLKRIFLPAMPSNLDDMEQFEIELEAAKKSMAMTIADIEAKAPKIDEDLSQQILMASLTKGISPLRVKAQYIIMDGMQNYQREKIRESDVFNYNLKKLVMAYNTNAKAISQNYAEKLNKLEGGEAGDEDEMAALELAKCKEINAEKEKYLAGLSPLVNLYAQRQEYISRKFYSDYAYWAPYWMPETTISFPSIESDYSKDIANILSEYTVVNKSDCSVFEDLAEKDGKLQEWEDEFCANFKGKIGLGGGKLTWDCNSWSVEGGEGIVGDFGMNYNDDGSFDSFIMGAGVGETWSIAGGDIASIEAGASVKNFIKVGVDKSTGKWEVRDVGVKGNISVEGKGVVGPSKEINVLEVSVSVNAGVQASGAVPALLDL